eukprot:s54_g16.t1
MSFEDDDWGHEAAFAEWKLLLKLQRWLEDEPPKEPTKDDIDRMAKEMGMSLNVKNAPAASPVKNTDSPKKAISAASLGAGSVGTGSLGGAESASPETSPGKAKDGSCLELGKMGKNGPQLGF